MSKYAKIVLWLGLAMIIVQLVMEWPQIRDTIFTPGTAAIPVGGTPAPSTPILGLPSMPGVPKGWPTQNGGPIPVKGKCPPGWFNRDGKCFFPEGL